MLAVNTEHEHGSVLSERGQLRFFSLKIKTPQNRRCSSWEQLVAGVHLRSVGLLLPEGHLIPQDGSIVLNHHCLLFNVSSCEQPQPLTKKEWCRYFQEHQRHCWGTIKKRLLPGCESGPDRYLLSTRSSSSGTGRTWGALLAACCGGQRLLLEPHSGWTWRCCWTRPAVGAFVCKKKEPVLKSRQVHS